MRPGMFRQGEIPGYIYIVVDGDFEILRNKKCKYKLIDPTKIVNLKDDPLAKEQLGTYLG